MPKGPTLSMAEALKAYNGQPGYGSALEFLKTNLSLVRTEKGIMKAYSGLSAAQALLGPVSPEYRKALEAMKGTLDSMVKAQAKMTPDEWLTLVQNTWQECCDLFQQYLPAEAWNAVGDKTRKLFEDLRG